MATHATGAFEYATWDEKPYEEGDDRPKLTRATVTNTFHGDIEGQSSLEYLMVYPEEQTGNFVGLERVVGRLGGRSGSFVLQHAGTFGGDGVKGTWFVVPGSGTGELRGLRGDGGYDWGGEHGERRTPFTLDYAIG